MAAAAPSWTSALEVLGQARKELARLWEFVVMFSTYPIESFLKELAHKKMPRSQDCPSLKSVISENMIELQCLLWF